MVGAWQMYSQVTDDSFCPATAIATGIPSPPSRASAAASAAPTSTVTRWTQVRVAMAWVLSEILPRDQFVHLCILPFVLHSW